MMPVDHLDNEPTDQGGYDKEVDKSSGNRPTTPKPTTQKRFSEQPEPTLCGDIGNAFPNAYTNEKVICYIPCAGIEFGDLAGKFIII